VLDLATRGKEGMKRAWAPSSQRAGLGSLRAGYSNGGSTVGRWWLMHAVEAHRRLLLPSKHRSLA